MPALNWIDWLCLAIIGLSLLLGLWRGLIYEVFSLVGWIPAFFVAQHYADALAPQLPRFLPVRHWGEAAHYTLAFVLLFVLVLIVASFLAWLLKTLSEAVGLRPIDRLLGGVFGIVRATLVLLCLTALAHLTPLSHAADWRHAQAAAPLDRSLASIKPLLPAKIQAYIKPAS